MSRSLPIPVRTQKQKMSTADAWLTAIEIVDTGDRYVNNIVDITYLGLTYQRFPFTLSPIQESLKGELPRTSLTIHDAQLQLQPALQSGDGLVGSEIIVRRLYADATPPATDTEIVDYFDIISTSVNSDGSVTFELGLRSPLSKRFPRDYYVASICRHIFKGGFCRYAEDSDGSGNKVGTVISSLISFNNSTNSDKIILKPGTAHQVLINGDYEQTFEPGQKIRVSGSDRNNGVLEIGSINIPGTGWTVLIMAFNYRVYDEAEGNVITVATICDKTITRCRTLNNSHMYGGSPGISEGIYG